MTDERVLEIRWHGEAVGHLADFVLETVYLPHTFKLRGQWFPIRGVHTKSFLQDLASNQSATTSGRLEVEAAGLDRALGTLLTSKMHTFFSLGDEGDGWIVVTDETDPVFLRYLPGPNR